jgi:putative DNA primase/helicase
MEALINKALPALRMVLAEQEFERCEKVRKSLDEFEKSNNPILEFFEELNEADYENEPIKAVYQRYNAFCLSNNLNAISGTEFQRQIKNHFGLVIKTVTLDGKKVRIYCYESTTVN